MPGMRFDFEKEAAALTPAIQMLMQTYTDKCFAQISPY
jgi:hypothetical protein